MDLTIKKQNHEINQEVRSLITQRYKNITRAINRVFWYSESETANSRYVGSYGRGTAIHTSDIDVLIKLPNSEYNHFTSLQGNGQSRLIQAVKEAVLNKYPNTDIKGDGQVVVIQFYDKMRFEILPAFLQEAQGTYLYPDTHMGGNWMSTNPQAEQEAMKKKNSEAESNGLLFDTCKHIRYVRDVCYSSYKLSGILIDSFVYNAIRDWHWLRKDEPKLSMRITYEQDLLSCYKNSGGLLLSAPGSGMKVDLDDWEILGKVLQKWQENGNQG